MNETYKEYDSEQLLELKNLLRGLFSLLDAVETSDSGREFHPTIVSSCRVLHCEELADLLPKIRNFIQ